MLKRPQDSLSVGPTCILSMVTDLVVGSMHLELIILLMTDFLLQMRCTQSLLGFGFRDQATHLAYPIIYPFMTAGKGETELDSEKLTSRYTAYNGYECELIS
jgi:hypothetical protein